MADEERTIEEEIDDLLGEELPAQETEEVVEEEVIEDEAPEDVESVVDEVEEVEEESDDDADESEPVDEVEEEEVEEVIEEDDEETQEVSEDAELDGFRAQMNRIAQAALEQGVQLPADLLMIGEEESAQPETPPQTPPVETPPAQPQTPPQSGDYSAFDILTEGVDFNDFLEDEEKFVGGMRDILQRHEQMLSQRFMSVLPGIVQNQTRQLMTLQTATEKFYRANEDLEPVRATVGAVANQIVAKNPSWDLDKVLLESAKTTRKLLKMPSPGKGKKTVNPSFAKSKSQTRKVTRVKKSKLQKEIDDILI